MKIFANLAPEVTDMLEGYRQRVMSDEIRNHLERVIEAKETPFKDKMDEPCSANYLNQMDHSNHVGFPVHLHGIDLNYRTLQNIPRGLPRDVLDKLRTYDSDLDDELQTFLGAKCCAVKMYYPRGGHIGWHNNWNAAGYNIIFTYSETGDGFWRHIDPSETNGLKPDMNNLVHIQDKKGWHCKVGYFGEKSEADRVMWHCAYTNEPRLTVGYVIYDKGIWENMVEELSGEAVNA